MHKINTGEFIELSEQEVVDCSIDNKGCVGGLPHLVYEYIRYKNISFMRDYPFDQSTESVCRKKDEGFNGKNIYAYTNLDPGIANLVKAVTLGPVAVISYASFEFKQYGGGIYKGQGCEGQEEPNHASLLVGYNLKGDNKYLYFKNGSGTDWGEDGYYKVEIKSLSDSDKGHCLIAATDLNSIPFYKL